jgi:predicted transposase/invertase (TIGR01784 family)
MPSVIHQPHDKFFRLSMGEPKVVTEFFTEHLPPAVLEKVNLAALKSENRTFIDEAYKDTEADVVYSTQINGVTAYLYLLCEHQSSIDPWMAFRLWIYTTRLMEAHRTKYPESPLPLIYPMVVYTGQEPWNAPLDIFSLFGEHEDLAKAWLLQPFRLLNIHTISDDDMRKRQWCGVVEFALKNKKVRDFQKFLKTLLPWLRELEQSGDSGSSFIRIVLKYILDGTETEDKQIFIKAVREYLSPALGDEIMTLAQQFRLEGQHQGIHQGIHQGEVAVMTTLLKHRFNQIPESYLARLEQADNNTLLTWSKKILDAKTLEEVFE